MSHLAFPGTVVCPTTLSAIQHFATCRLIARKTTVWIEAETNFCDRLDLFAFFIQAFAGNSPPEEAYERVLIALV